jgi:cell division protein FtsN
LAGNTPSPAPATIEQGDVSGPGDTVRTSLSPNRPAPRRATRDTYHVQVGAFTTSGDAQNRLGMVQQRASKLLNGHLPFTATFMKGDTEWYRARFAGFSKNDAQSTCAALKRMKLECIALSAE